MLPALPLAATFSFAHGPLKSEGLLLRVSVIAITRNSNPNDAYGRDRKTDGKAYKRAYSVLLELGLIILESEIILA